ncbi:DUF5666 domain-containing protein [Dokdonella immobilis]|uniref:DUF5666 domain-containing protein n=1 Tax=Dokdonella immobilis TaxID=578942 RepID=A0A1I4YTV8_9GAMM|nr:DUF5666 domain-containing protein [Dokdonella immobilis]SFN41464.1 hypothetical protein SAMN05216289_12013 [Dokdonella immobilis]
MHANPFHRVRRSSAKTPGRLVLIVALAVAPGLLAAAADSVIINGQRTFAIGPQTTYSLDGTAIPAEEAARIGAGYSAQVVAGNVAPDVSSGDAAQVDLRTLVRGPVTATDPLSVLRQPLVITAETVLVDIPGGDLANLEVGDLLDVSGFLDSNGAVAATRVALGSDPGADWKLFGQVSGLDGALFSIGAQAIDSTGVTPSGCVPALQDGQYVELESLPDAGYVNGSVLGQLTRLECEDPDFDDPPQGTIAASLEGIISALPDPLPTPASFGMLGVEVVTTAQTEYRAGTIEDLDVGVRVEVEGVFDAISATLTAHEVRFVQGQVRFEAPVDPADVAPGDSILIMGSSAAFSAQTRDEDGIVSGLPTPTQVELRGLIDRDGQIFATRVRERGQPDLTDTRLRGPVAEINAPQLTLLGVAVDTSTAQFRDHAGNVISSTEFFARVFPGTLVSAEDAVYDPIGATLVAGVVELEENTVPSAPRGASGPVGQGIARGTVTLIGADAIFAHGFE